MELHKMTKELAVRPQYAQYPNPNPKRELFGQTQPEPDPKSKNPTRHGLVSPSPSLVIMSSFCYPPSPPLCTRKGKEELIRDKIAYAGSLMIMTRGR